MKCHNHPDTDAIAVCARCNFGICQTCASDSHYHTNNGAPLCINCNAEVFAEEGAMLKSALKSKYIALAWFIAAFIAGVSCIVSMIVEAGRAASESDGEVAILGGFICFVCILVGNYIYIRDNRSAHHDIVNIFLFITFFSTAPVSVPTQIIIIFLEVKKIKKQIEEHKKTLANADIHLH
ncbi:MAG: hypothetical protein LBH93_08045 [Chitinispirillales bacterium]|jgi:hypothetical protein|nr:hypothetical protein [Chitinispirillales bacterium]